MKSILLQISGTAASQEPQKYQVEPGVTAGQFLTDLNLRRYQLTRADGSIFARDEELFPSVENGQVLHAVPEAIVGEVRKGA